MMFIPIFLRHFFGHDIFLCISRILPIRSNIINNVIRMTTEIFNTSASNIKVKEKSSFGIFLISLTGGAAAALSIICIPFVSPAFRRICLPYVPATTEQVNNVLQALKGRTGSLVDLGSGDGRIVLSAAKKGFKADGVELNPWLVGFSRISALTQGLTSKTSFFRTDLWKFNLKLYNNVVVFGVDEMMEELERKFAVELKSNATIVACRFPLPNSTPILTIGHGIDTVWVYKTPLQQTR